MRAATFFEKFELLADAPNAIEKMRELVLQLAITGRLSSDDGWADDSNPYSVPANWLWFDLATAADCKAGTKVSPTAIKDSDWVLDLEDINGDSGTVTARATFADRRSLSTKAKFIAGDVLYGKLRPYLNKVVIADGPGYCTTEIVPLRARQGLLPAFLKAYLRSPYFLQYTAAKNYGMKMPRLGTKDLESARLALPPVSEQKLIVAKVDELMALCDQLEAQQVERQTRHAALYHAALARFAANPTPDNLKFLFHESYDITPDAVRETILLLAVRGSFVGTKLTETVQLNDIIDLISGRHLKAGEWNQKKRGLPYLTGPADFGAKHPMPTRWTEAADAVAEPGDILLTVKGAGVGKTNTLVAERTAISRQLMAVRVKGADANFVHLVLQHAAPHFQEAMNGIAIPGIGRRDVLELQVALPALAEQKRIVAKVDQLMALVDELEALQRAERDAAARLMDALVAELTATTAINRSRSSTDAAAQPGPKRPHVRPPGARNRAAFTTYLAQRAKRHGRKVGAIASEKHAFLAEVHLGIDCHGRWKRGQFGPYDEEGRRNAEVLAADLDWFTVDRSSDELQPVVLGTKAAQAEAHLRDVVGDDFKRISTFTDRMAQWTARDAELYATLYAVWNDALFEARGPQLPGFDMSEVADSMIIQRFFDWHGSKQQNFTDAHVRRGLRSMRLMGLRPDGARRLIVTEVTG